MLRQREWEASDDVATAQRRPNGRAQSRLLARPCEVFIMRKRLIRNPGVLSAASDATRPTASRLPASDSADVARRAYDLYLARGRTDGHDVEDWLQAERELRVGAGDNGVEEFR